MQKTHCTTSGLEDPVVRIFGKQRAFLATCGNKKALGV